MNMVMPYEATGRRAQKARTRGALIAATRDLLARGVMPRVEDAAEAASISRTTAYRYFPNQRSLLAASHPAIEKTTLLGERPPDDPAARFSLVVDEVLALTFENEPELRATLRLSLDPEADDRNELVLRQGRVIGWLEEALEPLRGRVSRVARRRLVLATRAACGIEALVWLTDVAGLSRTDARALMRWSAHALYRETTERG